MKKIETYGIKIDMNSLRRAARMSENYSHVLHNSFYYDPFTGKIICYPCLSQNNYVIYGYYHFHNSTKHMTQQQIVDKLRERIEEIWCVSENK